MRDGSKLNVNMKPIQMNRLKVIGMPKSSNLDVHADTSYNGKCLADEMTSFGGNDGG